MKNKILELVKNNGIYVESFEEKIELESLELVSLIIDLEKEFNVMLMNDINDDFMVKLLSGEYSILDIRNKIEFLKI